MQRRTLATAIAAVAAVLAFSVLVPAAAQSSSARTGASIAFTILHTNDFHGQLQGSGSNPGLARVATVVNSVRAAKGAANVLLTDSGDEMQGSLLSNLQKGAPTIAAFDAMGYAAATFGNHEFDWGQANLADRAAQATYPFLSANIVSGSCDTGNWATPSFAQPYVVKTVAGVKVAGAA